jgi:hypothetical protein
MYVNYLTNTREKNVGHKKIMLKGLLKNTIHYCNKCWAWGRVVVKVLHYWSEGPGSIPSRVTVDFFRGIRQVHVPGVDSASNINEYQMDFLGVKAAGA